MKKNILKFLGISFLAISLFGCSKQKSIQNEGKISVVTTIFPVYDWATSICKDVETTKVELLVKSGTDLHSFQPSTSDMIKISQADLFIYVGGESDFWIKDALKNSKKDQIQINLMEVLSSNLKEEEIIEGMESDHNHEEEHEDEEDHFHSAEEKHSHVEYDEHIWLSAKNAEIACRKIAESIEILDLGNSARYGENLLSYLEKLSALQSEIEETKSLLQNSKNATLVVCDRFPFKYFTDELGLPYFAAFAGCSAETEASFETVAFLSNKVKELPLKSVFVTESSDLKLAKSVLHGAKKENLSVLKLNSMQNVTLKQIESFEGESLYISLMKDNLKLIKNAF